MRSRYKSRPSRNAGTSNANAKLDDARVRRIRARLDSGEAVKVVAIDEKISLAIVYGIRSGRRWSHVV